jgi:hypothetical protein
LLAGGGVMRIYKVDCTGISPEGEETLADSPAMTQMENLLLDHAGQIIKIKVTVIKKTDKSEVSHD